jgi:hypothetical protein
MPLSPVVRAVLVASMLVAGLTLPAGAIAKPPAKGKYECQQYSYGLGMYIDNGWVKIRPDRKYRPSGGNGGKYVYRAAKRKIVFRTGAYKKSGWHGIYEPKGTRGRDYHTITIRDGDGSDLLYCYRY